MRTRSTTWPWSTAALAVALALTIAACGGGGGGGNEDVATLGGDTAEEDDGTSSGRGDAEVTDAEREDAMLQFSACMREHGIDMPDPVFEGDSNRGSVSISAGSGEEMDPEEFEAADEACRHIIEDVMGERPQLSPEEEAEMRDQMLEFSECMREHGIDMPDPEFSDGGGGGMVRIGPGEDVDFDDEDFQAAQEACRDELGFDDGGPGGGPGMSFGSSSAARSKS